MALLQEEHGAGDQNVNGEGEDGMGWDGDGLGMGWDGAVQLCMEKKGNCWGEGHWGTRVNVREKGTRLKR